MTTDEVIHLLRANIDRPVKLTYASGEVETVLLHIVNDEGIVYDRLSEDLKDSKNAWWTTFPEIADVQPLPENPK
ncbi:MAG TPA: hypothetical protein VGV35_05580 [Bryobacteraceae bacterium]|nr:hypothetical protein [Bryobacteraceae bacterium]